MHMLKAYALKLTLVFQYLVFKDFSVLVIVVFTFNRAIRETTV